MSSSGRETKKNRRTDIVYDGVELGLVPRGEEDVESRPGELNRKLASNAVRCARDDFIIITQKQSKRRRRNASTRTAPRPPTKIQYSQSAKSLPVKMGVELTGPGALFGSEFFELSALG